MHLGADVPPANRSMTPLLAQAAVDQGAWRCTPGNSIGIIEEYG